ncbi:protein of unknown function (plasmid) [Agrobacterium pusense]|uniref:Uncharacterized protein n=1 Tax=Agrobacterium pusense TaxID=648995 RepID=U4QHB2_9HYPH|nr:protein of unknown function [Agrobacterium pusense]
MQLFNFSRIRYLHKALRRSRAKIISAYNAAGYVEKNDTNLYTPNNLTANKEGDGPVHVKFGDCSGKTANCIPITASWNCAARLVGRSRNS